MNFRELYGKGLDYKDFLKTLDIEDKEVMERYSKLLAETLDENLKEKIKNIDNDVKILVFAEGWCPDCQINMPPIFHITNINPNIKMKILKRDTNEKYLEPYFINGKPKIPTILLLDNTYREIDNIIERPRHVKELLGSQKESESIIAKRKYKKGEFLSEIIKDIIAIIK